MRLIAFACDSCGAGETTEDEGKTSRADCVCQQGVQRARDSPDVGTENAFCTACEGTQLFKNSECIVCPDRAVCDGTAVFTCQAGSYLTPLLEL